jgi:hypothetical protein
MKATKKILGASAALIASLGIAVGSTYAWFVSGNTATIDSIDLGVSSQSNNLLVTVVDANADTSNLNQSVFKSTLTASDFEKYLYTGSDSSKTAKTLKALTYDETAKTFKDQSNALNSESTTTTTDGYIQFKLVFRDIQSGNSVMLLDTSSVTAPTTTTAKAVLSPFAVAKEQYGSNAAIAINGALEARAANAARISFATSAATKVWCPNEALAGGGQTSTKSDNVTTFTTTNETGRAAGFWKGNLSSDYYTYMTNGKAYDAKSYTNTILALTQTDSAYKYAATSAISAFGSDAIAVNEQNYYQTEFTVTIWLEGTDGDCFDSVLSDTMTIKLQFMSISTGA